MLCWEGGLVGWVIDERGRGGEGMWGEVTQLLERRFRAGLRVVLWGVLRGVE